MTTIERIVLLLDKSGMSDAEFERRLGLKEKIVYGWKTGRSKSYTKMLPEIAEVLGTTSSFLLGEADNPAPTQNVTAAHLKGGVDISDLSEDDQQDIIDFIAFKREQRKNKV
ncbi:hypothetical protein [Christensenella minuta]|uniref:hypothetical protein n=1 Tax=Christensenella minuta TaxID=626937 RepID=UPI00215862E7|nr:hypothetical protein [Christensenella minuta]